MVVGLQSVGMYFIRINKKTMRKKKKFIDFPLLIVLGIMITISVLGLMTSCCTSVCEQGAPPLHPMPDSRSQDMLPCEVYIIEDIIEFPVTPSGK